MFIEMPIFSSDDGMLKVRRDSFQRHEYIALPIRFVRELRFHPALNVNARGRRIHPLQQKQRADPEYVKSRNQQHSQLDQTKEEPFHRTSCNAVSITLFA